MDPITILALANGAFGILETLVPHIAELFQKGEITAEQQKAVMDRYQSIKNNSAALFTGPEWTIDPK